MEILSLIIALVLMILGLAGTILPSLPSSILIYAGYAVYGFGSGWKHYGAGAMAAFGALTALAIIVDYLAGALGSKRYGGSSAGIWGSIAGALAGVLIFNVIGLIVGTVAGAVAGELLGGRSLNDAFRSGWGAFVGFVGGSLFKIMVAIVMIGGFFWFLVAG